MSEQNKYRPRTPGWVKVTLAIVGLLLAAFVVLHLTGDGFGHDVHHRP